MLTVAALAVWSTAAHALDQNDRLVLTLSDGRTINGWYQSHADGLIALTHGGQVLVVPVSLVTSAQLDDLPLDLAELHAWVSVDPLPDAPGAVGISPGAAVGLSLVWPGLGHAALGDWGAFAGYAAVDAVVVATGVWAVSQEQVGALLPLAGLDLLFRGWSAAEAGRIARRRRADRARASLGSPTVGAAYRGGLTETAAEE